MLVAAVFSGSSTIAIAGKLTEQNGNELLTTLADDVGVMLKSAAIAVLTLAIANQLDQYLSNGRYTDAAFAVLRQMRHSFGV